MYGAGDRDPIAICVNAVVYRTSIASTKLIYI